MAEQLTGFKVKVEVTTNKQTYRETFTLEGEDTVEDVLNEAEDFATEVLRNL